MGKISSIAVFCGSSPGKDPIFKEVATRAGAVLAGKNIELVYGGGGIGLMGAVADGALAAGGKVTGVIPEFLHKKEIAHHGLTKLVTVQTMHERKSMQYDMCDGIIVLPGGYGTLDEFFEILTWGQLGLHPKPVALLNIRDYFNPLIAMINSMVEEEFLNTENREMLIIGDELEEVLEDMAEYKAPLVPKWKELYKPDDQSSLA